MPFRPKKKQPQFADLLGILAQTKNELGNATYQTLSQLIERLIQFQATTLEQVDDVSKTAVAPKTVVEFTADKLATYLTTVSEVVNLPNSVRLLAGTNITFDDSIPSQRTISSSGGGGSTTPMYYDAPLTDGLVPNTELIFGLGECIIVQVPNV